VTAEPWTVRQAVSADLAAVLQIHQEHRGVDRTDPTPNERTTWERMMATTDLTVFLVESDGAPLATATSMLMPNLTYGCAPTAFIEAVVVVPEHRRRGIATAMMASVLDELRVAGVDKVQLLSHKRHAGDGAHDLYLGLGFVPEAEGFRLHLRGASAATAASGNQPPPR
jgi:GNAT superfamily N-acetyltransferase